MSIISSANLIALTDRLGVAYDHLSSVVGEASELASPVAGTVQEQLVSAMQDVVLGLSDFDQVNDLARPLRAAQLGTNRAAVANLMQPALDAIENHCKKEGTATSASIVSLTTYLDYLNTTRFSAMLAPEFSDLWYATKALRLSKKGVYAPAWHPSIVSGLSANGFGARAVGGSFTAGTALSSSYSEVDLIAEVTVDFADGDAAPAITVTGIDHTGASMTWTGTLGSNNPTAAVATTLGEALTAARGKKDTVTLASGTGVIAGSVLRINASGPNEEYVVVESVSTDDVVTFIRKNHASGEAVAFNRPLLLTPGTGGRKCASISNIVLTISNHTAGTVRIVGKQPRVPQHGS